MLLDLKDGSTQPIDGNFGTGTTNAVKDFQADVGLTQDGQVGANTWSAMRNQLTFQVLEDGWRYYRTASTNGNYPTKGGNTVAFRMNASTLRWQVYSIYTIAGVGCVCNWVQMDSTRTSP